MSAIRSALFAFTIAAAMSGCRQDTSRTQDNATPTENTAGTPRDPTVIPDDALRGDAQVPKPERSSRRPSLQRRSTVVKDKESMAQAEPEVPGEGSQFEPPTFTPPSQITPPAETTLPQDNITPPSEVVPPAEPITPQNAPTPTPTPTPNLPPGTQTFGSGVSPGVSAPNPVRPPLTTPQTTPGTTVQPTPGTAAPGTPQTTPPATPPVAPQPAPQTPPMGTTPQPFTPGPG